MKKKKKIMVIFLLILVFSLIVLIKQGIGTGNVYVVSDSKINTSNKSNIKKEAGENKSNNGIKKLDGEKNEVNLDKITVYISGAIQKPGIVTIESNKRLFDAIKMLGGASEDADLNRVNMAIKLEDEKHYIVPRIGEVISVEDDEINQGSISGQTNTSNSNANKPDQNKSSKVNINTADVKELDTLPGIGEATANKIIQHREDNGKFKSIGEIKNVNGIGEKKFENIKELISVN
ncbi:MAG: helix-hairpin-helix domain-containing protein [Clostridioides difficile]|nr:helix-hairpin-helix domain-containing protein [Clostridioides sp.]MBS5787577.1 helix-hairpin-helix domain-containing protein [Clostridioides difficile]